MKPKRRRGRAMHPGGGPAFVKYLLRPESNKVWKAQGLERFP
jgi:hypothetical protein